MLYVAHGGSDTSNACVDSVTPCATLSHALALPGAASAIVEVSGTIDDSVTIPVSVTITGADAPAGQPAVIDNNASGGSVFYIPNAGESVDLDDLTMTPGNTPYGGGINISGSGDTVQVNDSTITGNAAQAGGAGIHDNGSNLTVTDSTIADNEGGLGWRHLQHRQRHGVYRRLDNRRQLRNQWRWHLHRGRSVVCYSVDPGREHNQHKS